MVSLDATTTKTGSSSSRGRHHAVAIPLPAQGHINPMMHLCLKLARDHDFVVTFVATQYHHPLLVRNLAPVFRDQGLDIRIVEIRDKRATGSTTGAGSMVELRHSFFSLLPEFEELFESLIAASASATSHHPTTHHPPPSLIIYDFYLPFLLELGTKFSLPRIAFYSTSAGALACFMAANQGHRPDPQDLIRWIPGVPPLKLIEFFSFLQCFDPADLMYSTLLEAYQRLNEASSVVINTFQELEPQSLEALRQENPHIFAVGPLLPMAYFDDHMHGDAAAAMDGADATQNENQKKKETPAADEGVVTTYQTAAIWDEDHSCLHWLDRQTLKSVLFVSFGSIAVLTLEQFQELALGLEASGVPLLWVIRQDLMYGEKALFPVGYLERMKERACFVEWAPQLQVLKHGAVGGFLTHCGWNSTLESICAGVPMLGWPYFADQMLNNRCCVDAWGVGLAFESEPLLEQLVRRGEVERKVRELMGVVQFGDTMRERASYWRDVARNAAAVKGGSSERSWNDLMNTIESLRAAKIQEQAHNVGIAS